MYQHFIVIYGDYTQGKRIAYHEACSSMDEIKSFFKIFDELKGEFKNIHFGLHQVQTTCESLESVVEYDGFFSDIEEISSIEMFKQLVKKDTTVDPEDVARLIISKCKSTQLETQKLLFFFWCEYFKTYKKDIWDDDFLAWPLGPVIDNIYHKLKKYGSSKIAFEDYESLNVELYSRIIKIPEYKEILFALDETIRKFGGCGVSKLVDESHKKGGPWDTIYQHGKGRDKIIPKQLIKDYIFSQEQTIKG